MDPARNAVVPLEGIFERLQSAQQADPFPDLATRRRRLAALEALVADNLERIAQAINLDFGRRPERETRLLEGFPALAGIRHARHHVASWMRPRRRAASRWLLPGRTLLMPQPLGVVGIVSPWNYPLLLTVAPLAAALAAGNRAMLKLSEVTPRTAQELAALVAQYFREDEVAVVQGDAAAGAAFSSLPFGHLLFTGAGRIGRAVMHAAADNLTPVTLELGGKSPAIVAAGYPLEHAADRITFGKCINAGQTCVAPDYALVPAGAERAMLEALRAATDRMYPDLPFNKDFAHIVSERHFARLAAMLEEARAAGAEIVPLSSSMTEPDPARRRFPPVAIVNPPESSRLMRDEIFGPLLPVLGYRDLDQAIAFVNARERPLALYLFDRDPARVRRLLERTLSGGATVNDVFLHVAEETLPFGGVGASGMGAYHGRAGFETFSKMRPVFLQSRWAGIALLNPPFGARFDRMVRWMLRW
jgi:coniferyl-aldehyde dehydrogenase